MRVIGIRHRIKQTADGEARPTQVAILDENGNFETLELENELAELDLVKGRLPLSFRKLELTDSIIGIPAHQVIYRKIKDGESPTDFPEGWIKTEAGKTVVATKVPASYFTPTKGDTIAMTLGGSGDYLAFALARASEQANFALRRIPPYMLQQYRAHEKSEDAKNLAELAKELPELFYDVTARDMDIIILRESYRSRIDAMKARIACEQRLRQRAIGQTFCSKEGMFPEGSVEKRFDELKATDKIYLALISEEAMRNKDLEKACEALDVYIQCFAPIKGVGPAIASRIISAIVDIKRFIVEPDGQVMTKLYEQSRELEAKANLERDKPRVAHLMTPEMKEFEIIGLVKTWKTEHGLHQEATMLGEALELHHQRSILRRNARQKGMAKFKAYCGVHVLLDGRFPRRRNNEVANWSGECRQAFYLVGEQFNRRPDTIWGQKLREYKAKLRIAHPQVEEVPSVSKGGEKKMVKRYTDGHIHKMAIWKTLSKFAEALYKDWVKLEMAKPASKSAAN